MGFLEGYHMTAGNRRMRMEQERDNLALQEFAAERADKIQRETDAGKAAEYFFKSNPDALSAVGLTDKEFANLSAREQASAAMGYVQKQASQQLLQQLAQQRKGMEAEDAFGAAMERASSVTTTTPNVILPGLLPDYTVKTTRAPGNDEIMAALAATPGAWRSQVAREMLKNQLLQDPNSNAAEALNARANMLNAKANFSRATSSGGGDEKPVVPGYEFIPDGKGGWRPLPVKLNSQQSSDLSRLKDRRDSIKTQIAAYDEKLAFDPNAKTSRFGGVKLADQKAKLEAQLEDVRVRIAELEQGGVAPPAAAPKAGDGDLWREFMNSQK